MTEPDPIGSELEPSAGHLVDEVGGAPTAAERLALSFLLLGSRSAGGSVSRPALSVGLDYGGTRKRCRRDQERGCRTMRDILGRPVVTAAELEAMTEDERQASFEASIVWDLSVLPPEYVARLRAAAEERVARRDAAQRGIPHAL